MLMQRSDAYKQQFIVILSMIIVMFFMDFFNVKFYEVFL